MRWLVRLALGGLVLAWLVKKHGASLGEALHAVTPLVLLGSAGVYLLGQIISAWKWRSLLSALGAQVTLWTCCRFYWLGMFWNLWMPTSIGGDALRIYLINRHAPQLGTGRATASVIIERLTGLVALLLIGAVALPLDTGSEVASGVAQARRIFLVAGVIFALLGALGLLALRAGRAPAPLRPLLGKVQHALAAFQGAQGRRALVTALALSFVFQGSQVALNYGLARAVGLSLSLLTVGWVTPALALASLLPIGIGGLGVREAAALALLGGSTASTGVPPGAIVAWSLLWQVTVWLSSAPGALWALSGKTKPQE